MKIVKAPWTEEQIKLLDERQTREDMHPYTCECGHNLEPFKSGWYCENQCGYHQDWCLEEDVKEKAAKK